MLQQIQLKYSHETGGINNQCQLSTLPQGYMVDFNTYMLYIQILLVQKRQHNIHGALLGRLCSTNCSDRGLSQGPSCPSHHRDSSREETLLGACRLPTAGQCCRLACTPPFPCSPHPPQATYREAAKITSLLMAALAACI